MNPGLLTLLQDFDRQRPAMPGENLIKLGLGVVMLRGGLVSKAIGAALIYRAFTGKAGLAEMLKRDGRRYAPNDGGVRDDDFVEIAEPQASPPSPSAPARVRSSPDWPR
jgi:hypothetical protein